MATFTPFVDGRPPLSPGSAVSVGYVNYQGQPKAILVIGTADVGTAAGDAQCYIGAASGSSVERCAAFASQDAAANAVVSISNSAALVGNVLAPSGSIENSVDATALNENGWTGAWSAAVADLRHGVLAFNGASNAAVFSKALPGDTNNFAVTGLGFQPNFVILFGTLLTALTRKTFGIGWATATEQMCIAIMSRNSAATSTTSRTQSLSRLFRLINYTDVVVDLGLISFDADGLTLNDAIGSQTSTIYGLALKVPQVFLIYFGTPPSPQMYQVAGAPFDPSLMMCMSIASGLEAVTPDATFSFGFCAAPFTPGNGLTQQAYMHVRDIDAQATMDAKQACDRARIIHCKNATDLCIASVDSFIPGGALLNFTSANATLIGLVCFMGDRAKPTATLLGGQLLGGKICAG